MLCRLCLIETDKIINIYSDTGKIIKQDVFDVVAKHLQIEICYHDEVSNTICLSCLGYLQQFHKFWLSIHKKQKSLNSHLEYDEIEEGIETETTLDNAPDSKISNVVIELCAVPERDACDEGVSSSSETELILSLAVRREDEPKFELESESATEYLTDEFDVVSTKDAETEEDATDDVKQKRQTSIILQNVDTETDVEKKKTKRGRPKKTQNQEVKGRSGSRDFFRCSTCNKIWVKRENYMKHMNLQHPPGVNFPYKCRHCPKKFSKQSILDTHIKKSHTSLNPTCKLCNKTLANAFILRQHEKSVHRNEFESVCEICGKLLKTPGTLQYHMDNVHNTDQRPEVQCTVCNKWLKSTCTLRKHMMKHRDESSGAVFKCLQCNAEKSTKRSLSSHIRYHHSNKVYPCTMCEKEFKTPIALKEHEATHTGEYLYTCPFCEESFRAYSSLHKHKLRSHSKEFVPKHSQPTEFTQSMLNRARNAEKS